MSSELVKIGETPASLTTSTMGSGIFKTSRFFRLKPMKIDLTQAQSRRPGAIAGKFYNEMTGEHFDKMRVVMLVDPREARTKYVEGAPYGSSPECFSTDGIIPHDNAQSPQSLKCASCRHADWSRWKKHKIAANVPKCKNRYIVYAVDREMQLPYEIEVQGTSISPFFNQCQIIAGLAVKYAAKYKKEPALHYFSFTIGIEEVLKPDGKVYVMKFSDTAMMNEEDIAQFGVFVQQFEALKAAQLKDEKEAQAEANLEGEFSEGSTSFNPSEMAAAQETAGEVTI